jgi:hypothetical protein
MDLTHAEILFEGSYLYFQKEVQYSQEGFRLIYMPSVQSYQFYAEILSRIETGEFLKVVVKYDMSHQFIPQNVQIERFLGTKYSLETFRIDQSSLELVYTFKNPRSSHEFKRTVSSKHYLTSPAFCTSAIFSLTKKFEHQIRSPIALITSDNTWNFVSNPVEKVIYADLKSREVNDFKILESTLPASHLCLYEGDSDLLQNEEPVELFLSRHYSIPYQMSHGDLKIRVKRLKKMT